MGFNDDEKPAALEKLDSLQSLWRSTHATEKPGEARGSRGSAEGEWIFISVTTPYTVFRFTLVSSCLVILSVRSTIEYEYGNGGGLWTVYRSAY